jgi:hypothetical protein
MKIYHKALALTRDNIPSNHQLLTNLQKVISAAEGQLDHDRHRDLAQRRARLDKDVTELKHDVYSDFSRGFRIKLANPHLPHNPNASLNRRRILSRKEGRYQPPAPDERRKY